MSDHTAHVEPGGPSHVETYSVDGREVRVSKTSVGDLDNNVYLLTDVATNRALLIDAAADAERLADLIDDVDVEVILTTHGHRDHWQALAPIAAATGATTLLHPADTELVAVPVDADADDGAEVTFGGASVRLVHTPGHTPGGVCALLGDQVLFSGDTLFPGGPGGTHGDDEAFATIMTSLRDLLFAELGDDVVVHPGHGDSTTIGAQRPHLDEWADRGW